MYNFHLTSNDFKVNHYEYRVEKRQNKILINSRLEILGNFYFPAQTLSISYHFPNQKSHNNFLRFNNNEKCKEKYNSNLNCYIFENQSFISTISDKSLNTDLSEYINLGFDTKLEVNIENLNLIQSNNKDAFEKKILNYLSHDFFKYKNSYSIGRELYEQQNKTISFLTGTIIEKNKPNKYIYDNFEISFGDFSKNNHKHIKKAWVLKFDKQWRAHTSNSYVDAQIQSDRYSPQLTKTKYQNIDITTNSQEFLIQSNLFYSNKLSTWIENPTEYAGLFLPPDSKGSINWEGYIFRNEKVDKLKIFNFFYFPKNKNTKNNIYCQIYKKKYYPLYKKNEKYKMINF